MTSAKLGSASPRPDHGPRGSDQGQADAGCNNPHKTLEYASPRNSSPPAGPLINVWRSLLPTTAASTDAQRASVSEDDSEDDELIADLDNLLLIPEAIRSTPPPLRPSQVPPLRCPGRPSASSTIFGSPRLLLPKQLAMAQAAKMAAVERHVGHYVAATTTPASLQAPAQTQVQPHIQRLLSMHNTAGLPYGSPTPPPRGTLCELDWATGVKRVRSVGAAPSKRQRADTPVGAALAFRAVDTV
jgi:hypothetical protein